jgi:hypothetical protein
MVTDIENSDYWEGIAMNNKVVSLKLYHIEKQYKQFYTNIAANKNKSTKGGNNCSIVEFKKSKSG